MKTFALIVVMGTLGSVLTDALEYVALAGAAAGSSAYLWSRILRPAARLLRNAVHAHGHIEALSQRTERIEQRLDGIETNVAALVGELRAELRERLRT